MRLGEVTSTTVFYSYTTDCVWHWSKHKSFGIQRQQVWQTLENREKGGEREREQALVAREHMSLQPTWDSEQREETATPVTAHALGQTHTDQYIHSLCVCVYAEA